MPLYNGITLPGQPDLENVRRLDLSILPTLNRMSRVGIAVDVPYLQELSGQFAAEMADLQKQIASYIPPFALDRFSASAAAIEEEEGSAGINASSAEQIRELLFDLLGVGRNTKLKSTGGGKVSTGRKNLDLVRDQHPVVPLVIAYRERAKLRSAFCDALPAMARLHPAGPCCPLCELPHVESTNRLHTTFTTTRAITGRLSSRKPNLQQIPIRSSLGARIRAAFVASPGTRLVSVDFSGMEFRDMVHLANDPVLIARFNEDPFFDPHMHTAMQTFHIEDPAKVDKYLHRMPSKRTNFGIQNGVTKKGLLSQLVGDYWAAGISPPDWLTEEWCDRFIQQWYREHPEVAAYFAQEHYRARRYGFVWDPWGRPRYIPQVRSSLPYKVSEGLREAQNHAITASNAEQTKLVMAETEDTFDTFRGTGLHCEALLSIHDQIVAEVDEDYADAVGACMVGIFEHVMDDRDTGERLWRVPIRADCEVLRRWKDKE